MARSQKLLKKNRQKTDSNTLTDLLLDLEPIIKTAHLATFLTIFYKT